MGKIEKEILLIVINRCWVWLNIFFIGNLICKWLICKIGFLVVLGVVFFGKFIFCGCVIVVFFFLIFLILLELIIFFMKLEIVGRCKILLCREGW